MSSSTCEIAGCEEFTEGYRHPFCKKHTVAPPIAGKQIAFHMTCKRCGTQYPVMQGELSKESLECPLCARHTLVELVQRVEAAANRIEAVGAKLEGMQSSLYNIENMMRRNDNGMDWFRTGNMGC